MLTIRLYLESRREEMRASVELKPSKPDRSTPAVAAAPYKPIKPLNTWQLPFPGSANLRLTDQEIANEFGSLDLKGEGRLTYLDLLSSLRVREVQVDQSTVQRWLREADREEKGYVDIRDYFALYERRAAPNVIPVSASYPLSVAAPAAAASPVVRPKNPARSSPSTGTTAAATTTAVDSKDEEEEVRLNALRQTFTSYDKDGDGYLSVADVQRAFAEQGRDTDELQVAEWISRRDRSGHGAISLQDFILYYRNKDSKKASIAPAATAPASGAVVDTGAEARRENRELNNNNPGSSSRAVEKSNSRDLRVDEAQQPVQNSVQTKDQLLEEPIPDGN